MSNFKAAAAKKKKLVFHLIDSSFESFELLLQFCLDTKQKQFLRPEVRTSICYFFQLTQSVTTFTKRLHQPSLAVAA